MFNIPIKLYFIQLSFLGDDMGFWKTILINILSTVLKLLSSWIIIVTIFYYIGLENIYKQIIFMAITVTTNVYILYKSHEPINSVIENKVYEFLKI
jgi:hypothetical protein